MNLIQKVGGVGMAEMILSEAPESNFPVKWCLVRKKYVRQVGFNTQHLVNGEWIDEFNVNPWVDLDSLRTAIADHDRTDHCTDIRNHVSPNTKVIEMSEFDEWMGKKCSVIQSAYGEEYIAAQEAWDFQQAKIDNLKAQLNNMEACYIEKKKQVDACAALAAGWSAITWDKTTHWTEGYEEGCYHCSGQIEEALRGTND